MLEQRILVTKEGAVVKSKERDERTIEWGSKRSAEERRERSVAADLEACWALAPKA